jgi:ElaB/YqjD/DUF883 family membrane-anchored ribosome-binding protein
MPQEPEEIRQEMDETRDALTDKISMLEKQVVDTVHDASTNVKETVQAVKDTVQTVKDSVGDTFDSVKETFSVTNQVQQRPWLIMAGAAGVGFAAGYLLSAPERTAPAAAPAPLADVPRPKRAGNGSHRPPSPSPAMSPGMGSAAPAAAASAASSVADSLTQAFEGEINQIKGLAIGTLAGIIRDMVVKAAPEMIRNPLNDIFDDMTVKLGGQAIKGRILSEDWSSSPQQNPSRDESRDDDRGRPSDSGYRNPRQTSYTPNL